MGGARCERGVEIECGIRHDDGDEEDRGFRTLKSKRGSIHKGGKNKVTVEPKVTGSSDARRTALPEARYDVGVTCVDIQRPKLNATNMVAANIFVNSSNSRNILHISRGVPRPFWTWWFWPWQLDVSPILIPGSSVAIPC